MNKTKKNGIIFLHLEIAPSIGVSPWNKEMQNQSNNFE